MSTPRATCSIEVTQLIERLKTQYTERAQHLASLRVSIESLINTAQPGGPRGTLAQRQRGYAMRSKLDRIERKHAESEKLLAHLEKSCVKPPKP